MKHAFHAIYWLLIVFTGLTVRIYCNGGGPCPDAVHPVIQKAEKEIFRDSSKHEPLKPIASIPPDKKHTAKQEDGVFLEDLEGNVAPDTFELPADVNPCDPLLEALNTVNIYEEEYVDSAMNIKVTDTIFSNQLSSQHVTYTRTLPEIPVIVKHNGYYAGWHANAGANGFTSTGPSFLFINKRDRALGGQYDILNNSIGATALVPIKFNLFKKK